MKAIKKRVISVRDLSYTYGNDQLGLESINLNIYQGEKIAVLGANGAGKSTLFLNLNGVLKAEKGEIYYRDQLIDKKNLKQLRKNIGIVFQDADSQIIASTVRAEVAFGPMNLKLPKEEVIARVDQALSYMNMLDFKDRPPHYLSGGEKKRISIADIIAMKSELVIFDEPTASLDPLNAEILEEVLEKLSKEGKTLLISTHDVDFAYRWAERVLVFDKGRIIADGSPLEIFQDNALLKKSNLLKPHLLKIYELLIANKIIADDGYYPKSIQAFEEMIEEKELKESVK